jgi:peptidoglycan lytic transglycosylase
MKRRPGTKKSTRPQAPQFERNRGHGVYRVGVPRRVPGIGGGFLCPLSRHSLRLIFSLFAVAGFGVAVSACHGGGERLGPRVVPLGAPVPKGGGRYMVGEPYEINGHWYSPRDYRYYSRVGVASWYGDMFYGRRTANGEIYDANRLTAANPTLPLPAYVRVTDLENGRTIVVRVNDRGPYSGHRLIDLSRRAADVLGFRRKGTALVRVTFLGMAPLNGDDSYERRFLAAQGWAHYAAADGRQLASDPIAVGSIPEPSHAYSAAKTEAVGVRAYPRADAGLLPPPRQPAPEAHLASLAPATAGAAAGGLYAIQAGSFKVQANAVRAESSLGAIGRVEVDPVDVQGQTYYRVRVGPFSDRGEAEAALSKVTGAGYTTARVVSN